MNIPARRTPLLQSFYHQYLADQNTASFIRSVNRSYECGTLERLLEHGSRLTRRAAALALGFVGHYESNQPLGRALQDNDRGVRTLAENSLRAVWCRAGDPTQQHRLQMLIQLNTSRQYESARRIAADLIELAPWIAEAWNQRAIAHYGLQRWAEAIHDCYQCLEINPYHFGAASGMGQCYLQAGNRPMALECFRRAIDIHPDLEGVRANVAFLEREMNK